MISRKSSFGFVGTILLAVSILAGSANVVAEVDSLETQVIRYEDRVVDPRDWGAFEGYFGGNTSANGAVRVSKGTINPGEWPHPPHQHDAEEIIHILSGEGTWFLNGEELPASAGDMVFIASQDPHTLKNTGMEPVEFLVIFLAGPSDD